MTNYSNEDLFKFIKESPTAFHTCKAISSRLIENGFKELKENSTWEIDKQGKYFVTRNDSSVIAFDISKDLRNPNFQICASHSDSPRFKLKEKSLIEVSGNYTKFNSEGYGGMICHSWFDRPLSIAGRITYKDTNGVYNTKLINIDKDIALIPSVAIHMNRNTNENATYNKQTDMQALFSEGIKTQKDFNKYLLSYVNQEHPEIEQILGSDLYLYNRQEPSIWGMNNEFISAPQLDDLQCAYSTLLGFISGKPKDTINVYACFDNEEVGSGTRQGAASSFLRDTLKRLFKILDFNNEDYQKALASSFMISADNAHAVHPNHPELTDTVNNVFMNQGIVIKVNASQKYTTDGLSSGIFKDICDSENIPTQKFANRSDKLGGSTLGNISSLNVPILSVDIGLPQLAMHSAYETSGSKDGYYLAKTCSYFYNNKIKYNL